MQRTQRILLVLEVLVTCFLSWIAMQILHESGHVFHAWLSGGKVTRVVISPIAISRTDVNPNPHPRFVAWGGAVWGCLLPALAYCVCRGVRFRWRRHVTFLCGFCWIANGLYLGLGPWYAVGDAADLLRLGESKPTLGLFGAAATSIGLTFWHRLGPRLGYSVQDSR